MESNNGSGSTAGMLETPFLEVYQGAVATSEATAETSIGLAETPFISEYSVDGELVGGEADGFRELVSELYDTEFDEAMSELLDEADARVQLLGLDESGADTGRVERALHQWLEPLREQAETLLEQMSGALGERDPAALTEDEVDELFAGLEPQEVPEGPVFEDFLKKLWNKAKSAVKGAARLVKKGVAAIGKVLPINLILNKLKGLVRPLLRRVLKLAMNRLPDALRPAAERLAKRFLGTAALEAYETVETAESPASTDVRSLQSEFDAEVASLLLASGEPDMELQLAEAGMHAERGEDSTLGELDAAREDFIQRLANLEEGEDPTPLVEQFLPAILPALRLGIGVVGRSKVVGFLAGYLGRLIAPYVGPQLSPPLSRAIVDAGLRLMTLEAGEDEATSGSDRRLVAEAFAALVEDTAHEVTRLDEDELEDEGVVEGVAFEAFHRSARSYFPPSVLRRSAVRRGAGVWVGMPRRGPRRYHKYSRVVEVVISPEAAALVKTRGGRTLAMFLRDRLGRVGPVRARVHVYSAVPGTRLGVVARAERNVPGLGPAAVAAHTELHPLTREAAGALLADPELGVDVSEEYLDELAPPAIGQRFYYLEVAGGRPSAALGPGARSQRPRLSTTTVSVDMRRGELRIALYLSEALAQEVAGRMRRREPVGAVLTSLRPVYAGAFRAMSVPGARRRLCVLGEAEATAVAEQLVPLPAGGQDLLVELLSRWTRRALAAHLTAQRESLVQAAARPEDGVTVTVTFAKPPGLALLAGLARGRIGAGALEAGRLPTLLGSKPDATIQVVAGYRRA